MNLIENRASELRADFVSNAHQLGLLEEEIASALSEDDGCDSFLIEAENEARRALSASSQKHRRAIRAATPRQPATRRAPRRAAKKASASAGGGDGGEGDGLGVWHSAAIDQFFDLEKISKLSESFSQVLSRLPDIVFSITRRADWSTRSRITSWSDSKTGCKGTGVTAMVAHIENISKSDATDRLAKIAVHFIVSSRVLSEDEALALFRTS